MTFELGAFLRAGGADADEVVLVGSDDCGPDEAFCIGELFGDDAHQATDADAVAAHVGVFAAAVLVGELEAERFGIFVAEREDVADFGGGVGGEIGFNCAQISEDFIGEDFLVDGDGAVGVQVDGVFADVEEGLVFVAVFAEDAAAGEGFVGAVAEAEPLVDFCIGDGGAVVEGEVFFLVAGEVIHVFHEEFSAAHDAGFGAGFVSEFGLDLVDVEGEVFVAIDVLAQEVGEGFFVGGGEAEFAADGEVGFEPDVHFGDVPAFAGFPDFAALEDGELDFLAADLIHFFTDDTCDVVDDAQAEGEVVVDSGHFFVDEAGADEELGILGNLI